MLHLMRIVAVLQVRMQFTSDSSIEGSTAACKGRLLLLLAAVTADCCCR
jgi:hypothetical protein